MSHPGELLSIIVPVYNEARTVRAVVERLLTIELPVAREILVVDDGSTDGTREVLDGIEVDRLAVTVLRAERNGGKGSAIRRGLARATGTIIAIQDADLELDPQQLARLVEPIIHGQTAVVYGSRFLSGASAAPWITVVANRVLTATTNVLYGASITDMETCYKVMKREVASRLELESERFGVEPEITCKVSRLGARIYEVPISYNGRTYAEGKKIGLKDGVQAVWTILKYAWWTPSR